MIVDLLVLHGGAVQRLSLNVTQVVLRQDNGTPVFVAAECGADRAQRLSMVGDDDFDSTLRSVCGADPVIVDVLDLPKPSNGTRVIPGPGHSRR